MIDEVKLEHRLTQVEAGIKGLDGAIRELRENDLKHIQVEVRELKKWIWGVFGSTMLSLILLILHHIFGTP